MRRILPLAVPLLSLASLPALAQDAGLHLTVARASLSSTDAAKPAMRIGGGVSLEVPFTDHVGLRTGVSFARKGMRFGGTLTQDGTSSPLEADLYVDYIELPALLRIGIPIEGRARPHVLLGPALAINVVCALEIDVEETSPTDCSDALIRMRNLDIGLTGGLGVALTSGRGVSLRLDALYNLGLRGVLDDAGAEAKNRTITAQAGIAFPLG